MKTASLGVTNDNTHQHPETPIVQSLKARNLNGGELRRPQAASATAYNIHCRRLQSGKVGRTEEVATCERLLAAHPKF